MEQCRVTATLQTGTKRPCCTCYVPDELLRDLEHTATPRTVDSEMHVLRNMLACKTVKAAEEIQTEWSTHPVEFVTSQTCNPSRQCVLSRWNFSHTTWGNPFGACVADIMHVLDSGMALHMLENHIAVLSKPEWRDVERRKKTIKGETPSVILRLPGGSSYFMSGANYAAFEHRSMMQVMPILVADKSALRSGKDGELAALRVRAFRMYATFYKAFLGVSAHTEASLAIARAHAIKLVEILPQAYPDHASHWRFPKIHMIVHLLDNVIMRGMPHHYSTEMWEHTHKGTVKIPVRGSNWKDIPRRIVEEEVQREICREVAQDAGGGRQYATALCEAVEMMKPVITRKGRTMRPAEKGDAVMGTYRTALGDLMDALPGSIVAARITASAVVVRTHVQVYAPLRVVSASAYAPYVSFVCTQQNDVLLPMPPFMQAHTAVAVPRTKGGALVSKGAFIKASPKEKWFTDFAVKSPKKEEWYAKALCIFKAETADGDRKGFVYVRWYERAGICPLTTCVQLTPSRKDTRHAVIAVESILRVAPPEKVFTFTEFPLIPTRVPLGTSEREQLSREWHMPVCFMYNATGCVRKPPIVVLRRDDKRPIHEGRKKEHDVKVRYAKNGRFSGELFMEYMDEFNGELHAKNEKAVVLVHNPTHTLTGCVKRTSTADGFVVEELTRVKVVQTFGVMPAVAFSAINGVVDALKAVFRTWFMRSAVTSPEWTREGVFPRPPLHDVLYKHFMAGKLTMPGTIQRSWWRAGTVPKGWLSRMDRLKGKAAAGMFDCLVVDLTSLQLVIEEFKSKCSSGAFMTAWDFVGCDEVLIEKWAPEGDEEVGSEDEIPAYFCIPEGPLMCDSRSCRRVSRMVHGGFIKHAEAKGIPPRDVPEEAGVVNEEVVSRLRRTPTKRIRAGSSSDKGLTSDASDEGGHIPKAGVLFPVEDAKERVPAGVSCYLWCALECTSTGRIMGIFSDPSRQDMPGPVGFGGSCPPGALSPAIGDLAELSSLVFHHLCLTGDLPDSVTRLQKLTKFEMPENNFSGPIPSLPPARTPLRLSGSLPDGPDAYFPSLETVILSGNALSGELPRALLHAPALRRLDLQSNNITGELPGGTGTYSRSITALSLRNNSLSGAIPPALAEMTALRNLDLGENRLSGAVPAALRDSESFGALEEVRLDSNALTGPFCDALLPAREVWLGFNDLGATSAGSSASASGGGCEEEGGGSLHGCVLPAKLKLLSAPHAGLRGSVPPDLFLATTAQSGRTPRLYWTCRTFSGGIPEAYFTGIFTRVDLRFNDLRGPLFDARWDSRSLLWVYDWDVLRVSNNSARMVGAVGSGYLPAPAPGVQASAAETAALLAVRDALLGEAAGGAAGGAARGAAGGSAGIAGLVNGGSSSWAEILRSWDASSSSACAWYGVGCTADGHVDTLHLEGNINVTMQPKLTQLRISGHVLSGGLPPSLSRLSHLVALDLSSNCHLSGSIPPALFTLPSLRELTLRGNTTTAAAAAAAVEALSPSLEILDVGGNALSGSIAAQVGLLTGLTHLVLDHNRLDGSLPRELGALWMLTDLQLQGNALQGDVSALAAAFPAAASAPGNSAASSAPLFWGLRGVFLLLTRLDVSSNELSCGAATLFPRDQEFHTLNFSNNHLTWGPGSNASWHADCLDLSHNRISAPLQDFFGDLSKGFNSAVLRLSHNQLSGPIPAPLLGHRVTHELDLSHNLLTGSISAVFNNLQSEILDLSHNQLTGIVPQLGGTTRLPLSFLDLSSNNLTGSISSALMAGLTALTHLNISNNLLSGSLPPSLARVPPLTHLDLSRNKLKGSLPALGQGQQRLAYLDLSFNAFTGSVAENNYPCSQQQAAVSAGLVCACGAEVRLSHNELTGFVFSSCLSLLDLSHNQLSGPIPEPPQGNSQLAYLDLSFNKLTGSISDALVTGLTALSHLDLSNNLLPGSLPRSLALVPLLTHLDLSRNKLKDSLPAFCQGKQRLASLLLSSNAFSGPLSSLLPSSSSSCASSLLSLNVSTNQLSGSLPSSLSRFTALQSLLAARNRMSGSIPAGLASLTALQELDVSWSGLSGIIPVLLHAAAPSLQVQLAGNALSGSIPPSLSDLPTSYFCLGNPKLCGKPLPDCKKRSTKPRKGRV
ncbi:unnamed protein product [Closterium sp. Yama58-4]|nr:unnamed protein product [Closterium sp. Yama58-4]